LFRKIKEIRENFWGRKKEKKAKKKERLIFRIKREKTRKNGI
jgi:hypothetical protein